MQRNGIKRAGILFVTFMVCFTFVSRAAQSAATAVVETKKAVSGRITHEISASGRIEAGSEFAVLVPEGLQVTEICAEEGDEIEEGALLFRTAGNTTLARAGEDFLSWERKASMDLSGLSDKYLQAYEDWQRYLAKTEGWYWKAEDDLQEDELELAVREKEYEYFHSCRVYFNDLAAEAKIRLGSLSGDAGRAESAAVKAQKACQKLQKKLNTAKNEYWAYKRNRERSYQFARKDDEKKYREALEKAIPEYEGAIGDYESELLAKIRAVEDASGGCMDENGNVFSPAAGVIQEIDVKEGAMTPSSASAVIAVSSQKKQLRVQISADMEKYLSAGDECVLKKYGASEEIRGQTVTKIAYDEKDASLLDVTVEVQEESLSVGDMVTADFSKQSEPYPLVVPLDSIHMEAGETYVLALKEREGILGKILEAEKLSVKILEQNGDYAAVSSDELADREIIVRADRATDAGSRVRKKVV